MGVCCVNALFAETLRKLRTEKGISQSQLGKQLFVNHSTVARWENGSRLPDASMIPRLADSLGVDANTLFNLAARSDENPNVILVDELLQEKFATGSRFISYFRTEFGQNGQWAEPPSEFALPEFATVSLQPVEWSGSVLYNGTNGIPASFAAGHRFTSPLVFSLGNGWLFYDNENQYAHHVAQEIVWRENNEHVEE